MTHNTSSRGAPRSAAANVAVVAGYCRRRDLVGVLPLWPSEIADDSVAGRTVLIARLQRALRSERQRGLAGHWTYSVSRHAQLARAYRGEIGQLRLLAPQAALAFLSPRTGAREVVATRQERAARRKQLRDQRMGASFKVAGPENAPGGEPPA